MLLIKYYSILELKQNSTIEDLNFAFRNKVKEFHGKRINGNLDKFIFLIEAYEYLKLKKTGHKISLEVWLKENQENSKQKAIYFSELSYSQFIATDFYKETQGIFIIWQFIYLLSAFFILIPLFYYWYFGYISNFAIVIFLMVSSPFWAGLVTQKLNLNLFEFINLSKVFIKTPKIILFASTFANILLLTKITLNSLITITSFLTILAILYVIGIIIVLIFKKISKKLFLFAFIPTIFNWFFLINFIFSNNPKEETYIFIHETIKYKSSRPNKYYKEKVSLISLENNAYDEYPLMRFFLDFESHRLENHVHYTFEDGLMGIKVLKNFYFSYSL